MIRTSVIHNFWPTFWILYNGWGFQIQTIRVSIVAMSTVNKALSVRTTLFHTSDLITYFGINLTFPHRKGALLVLIHAILGVSFYIDDAPIQIDRLVQREIDNYLTIGQADLNERLSDVIVSGIFSSFAGMQHRVVDVVQRAAFREVGLLEEPDADDLPGTHIENRKFRGNVHAFTVDALLQEVRLVGEDIETFTYVLRAVVWVIGFFQVLAGPATLLIGVPVRKCRLINYQTREYRKQIHAQGFTTSWLRVKRKADDVWRYPTRASRSTDLILHRWTAALPNSKFWWGRVGRGRFSNEHYPVGRRRRSLEELPVRPWN